MNVFYNVELENQRTTIIIHCKNILFLVVHKKYIHKYIQYAKYMYTNQLVVSTQTFVTQNGINLLAALSVWRGFLSCVIRRSQTLNNVAVAFLADRRCRLTMAVSRNRVRLTFTSAASVARSWISK